MSEDRNGGGNKSGGKRFNLRFWICLAVVSLLAGAIYTRYSLRKTERPEDLSPFRLLIRHLLASLSVAGIALFIILPLKQIRRFFRWLFSWRTIKRLLFAAGCLLVLTVLAYIEENWRGKHAWEKYKREWEAKGERFDFKSFIPPQIPDGQNFALAPVFYASNTMNVYRHAENFHPDTPFYPRSVGGWEKGQLYDLKEWQHYYRIETETNLSPELAHQFPIAAQAQTPAVDVLLALSKYDSNIEELRQMAAARPFARFPISYTNENPGAIYNPQLSIVKGCVLVLELRGISELQIGQPEKALADIQLMLRLADVIKDEPLIISRQVRASIISLTIQVIWEGVVQNKFSETQLAQITTTMADINLAAEYNASFRGERAIGIGILDSIRHWKNQKLIYLCDGSDSFSWDELLFHLMPDGWFRQNQVALSRMFQSVLIATNEVDDRIISRDIRRKNGFALTDVYRRLSPYNTLAGEIFPEVERFAQRLAFIQNAVNLARLACALERYQLVHNEYPDTLTALTPGFIPEIPNDVINGRPMHYHRSTDGKFVLYSVGWNEVDNGGDPGLKILENGYRSWDIDQGDWVWPFPTQ